MNGPHAIGVLCALSLAAVPAGPGLPGGYRISDQGPPGDPSFGAIASAVAYNGAANEVLVVWQGDVMIDAEPEIFCQRINAATGAEIGRDDFRISEMGDPGGVAPSVAYNENANEYLVAWQGTKIWEVYVQRLDAQGNEIGGDLRISTTDPGCSSTSPKVVYNTVADEYLVVWSTACVPIPHLFGQRLDARGAEIGADDFQIDDGEGSANAAAVAYNGRADEYLVVFRDLDRAYARRFDPNGDPLTGEIVIAKATPSSLDVAYDSVDNEYLVVWHSSDESLAPGELEIFGQRLDAAAGEIGADNFRISDMGTEGDPESDARSPNIVYDALANEYLVLWHGDDGIAPLVEGEFEIFGQRLDAATGTEVGPNDFRISRMGPDGNPAFIASGPAAAFDPASGDYLVAWYGQDDTPPQVDGEWEIFIRRIGCPWDCADGDDAVGIADLLSLLGQWGEAGTCDTDGGGVARGDLLALVVGWGPCP